MLGNLLHQGWNLTRQMRAACADLQAHDFPGNRPWPLEIPIVVWEKEAILKWMIVVCFPQCSRGQGVGNVFFVWLGHWAYAEWAYHENLLTRCLQPVYIKYKHIYIYYVYMCTRQTHACIHTSTLCMNMSCRHPCLAVNRKAPVAAGACTSRWMM